jgi:hypothetical protein
VATIDQTAWMSVRAADMSPLGRKIVVNTLEGMGRTRCLTRSPVPAFFCPIQKVAVLFQKGLNVILIRQFVK